jgi:hypothetical protein
VTDSFRTARWIRTLNLVLQAILFLTFIGGLNYLAGAHVWRKDMTRYRRFSLSPETLSYLGELSRPVHIVVTSDEKSDNPEVDGLLREYVNATESNPAGQITVENVDIYQDRRKTEKYGVDRAGIILLLCGDKQRALTLDDLYQVEDKVRKAFIGEQAVTAAILDVTGRRSISSSGTASCARTTSIRHADSPWSRRSFAFETTTSTPSTSPRPGRSLPTPPSS